MRRRRPPSIHGLASVVVLSVFASSCTRDRCDYSKPSCGEGKVCAFVEPGKARCVPFAQSELQLQAPFRPGMHFWCSQGGRSPVGRSHSFQGDLFALDLASTSTEGDVEVVSPVGGTATVFDECEERAPTADAHNDSRCGLGYGNHVKVWDGTNLYLFAHLARVIAKPGPIEAGQTLGVMGCSGAAGHRHLHLTVTRPAPTEELAEVLATPGRKGPIPVRYPFAAHDAKTGSEVVSTPDALPCADPPDSRTLLVR